MKVAALNGASAAVAASLPGSARHSFAFARVMVNGAEAGEAGLYGALAAEHGVPVALLTGDDVFIAEATPQ